MYTFLHTKEPIYEKRIKMLIVLFRLAITKTTITLVNQAIVEKDGRLKYQAEAAMTRGQYEEALMYIHNISDMDLAIILEGDVETARLIGGRK